MFGDVVRTLRQRQGLTQEELADKAGIGIRTVRDIETGRATAPRMGTMRLLADALGLQGSERDRFHDSVRNGHGYLTTTVDEETVAIPAAAPRPTPAQLPPDSAGFTGRTTYLRQLDAFLPAGDGPPADMRVVILSGTPGVGKTALAVHWAHTVRDRFPDGQLYLNLRGFDPSGAPLAATDALGRFLRALGVPAHEVPVEVEEAASLYRSLLADRRVLVLLDNVASAEQVRPLIPAAPGCLVLVTSRNQLGGLVARDGARRMTVDALDPEEAVRLLTTVLGPDRVATESTAAVSLAEICAYLPLTLRIAAASIADRPGERIRDYLTALLVGDRLDELAIQDDQQSAVRTTFELSYRTLAPDTQRMFRLLGLTPGADWTPPAAAALAGTTVASAERLLHQLASAHMVQQHLPGRYTFHDLLRLYARQQAEQEEDEPELAAAVDRLCQFYLHAADNAARLLYPQLFRLPLPQPEPGLPLITFDDHIDALSWLDAERVNLVAVTDARTDHRPRPTTWFIADTLRGYFGLRQYMLDWLVVAEAGLAAAIEEGSRPGRAAAHHSLAQAHHSIAHFPEAIAHLKEALALSEDGVWWEGRTAALCNLGIVYADLGELDKAVDHFGQALALNRRTHRRNGVAVNLNNLGDVYRRMGRLPRAMRYLMSARAIYQEIGSPTGYATVLTMLGGVYREIGELGPARDHVTRAVALHQEIGDRYGEAVALAEMSAVHRTAGRHAEAVTAALAALTIARELVDKRTIALSHNALADAYSCRGQYDDALAQFERARRSAREAHALYPEAEALLGLAAEYRHRDDPDAALEYAGQSLAIARRSGFCLLEGRVMAIIAEIKFDCHDFTAAAAHAHRALVLHRHCSHFLGQSRAQRLMARARQGVKLPHAAA